MKKFKNTSCMVRYEGSGKKIKIMQISDLHKAKSEKYLVRIADVARKESPDVIFITGDLVSRDENDFFYVAEVLMKILCDVAPIYMCIGNHEQSMPKYRKKELFEKLRNSGVVILKNRCVKFIHKGETYNICGIMPKYTVYKKNGKYRNLDSITADDMEKLLGKRPEGIVLLLAHTPIFAEAYEKWGADYTFSGHVHGGMVRIGDVGLFSPERKFFPKYTKGVYKVGKMKLCVTAGIGKFRLFNPSEIVIYNI